MTTHESSAIAPQLLEALGRVVVTWSYVEMMVSDLFVHMSNGGRVPMVVVTSNVSMSSVSGWIRTLLDHLEDQNELTSRTRQILTEIDELRGDRNAIVHGHWTPADGISAWVHTTRLERREVLKSELVTVVDLEDMYDHICDVTVAFVAILKDTGVHGYSTAGG